MIEKSLINLVKSNQLMQLVLFLQKAEKSFIMENIEDAIKLATEYGFTSTLTLLLVFHREHAPSPFHPSTHNQCLQIASARGDIDTIEVLIRFGTDINEILPQLRSCAERGDDANALYIMGSLQRKGYEPVIRKDLVAAKENFKKAAERNHPKAILELGYMHRDEGDFIQAKHCFEKLLEYQALQGDVYCALGQMHQMGQGCDIDCKIAEDDYQSAIQAGHQKAKVFLGQIYHQDQSNPQKQAEAINLWQDAAWQGDMDACWELMQSLGKKNYNPYRTLAYCYSRLLEIGDQLNIGTSIGRLGWMHEHEYFVRSEGEQVNHTERAYASYKKAVELGQGEYKSHLARVAFTLGKLHLKGIGMLRNIGKGISFLQEAIQLDHGKAASYLARQYELGSYVKKDMDDAKRYYQIAIDLGETEAELKLNRLPSSFIIHQEQMVCQQLKQTAECGDADAQNKLGECYFEGRFYDSRGQKQDKNAAKAFYWWRKAAHQGQQDAQKYLRDAYSLFSRMTFLFRKSDDQTKIAYYYNMSQGNARILDLFFRPDNFFSFDRNVEQIKNRLILSLFIEDDLIDLADKKTMLEEIIEKKFSTPASFVACIPTESTQRRALAEVLETISKPSIDKIVQTALASLVGIQPALRRAEHQLQVFLDEQPENRVNKVKQDLQLAKRVSYASQPHTMLVFTLLQLQNLMTEFRENVINPAQPMANHHVKDLQTFNKTFCLIIQNERVKGNLTKEAHKRLLAIYKDLCQSEIQLQLDQDQLTEAESFEQALELRLFALWIGASALASGHVMRQPTRKETFKREIFHIGAALCHIVPGLSVIPEFLEASAEIIETFHKTTEMSHIGLMVASTGHIGHAGWEIGKYKQTPDQKLMNFYHNLGRQGESMISSLVNALNQRFKQVLNDLSPQDATKFGDAMAEHIAHYLMFKPLSRTERKNLVPTLIYRCSYYPINSHSFVKWQGVNISIAEIIQRLSLRCSFVTAGETLSCNITPIKISDTKGQTTTITHISEPQGYMLAFEEEVTSFAHQLKLAQRYRLPQAANYGKQHNVNDLNKKMSEPLRIEELGQEHVDVARDTTSSQLFKQNNHTASYFLVFGDNCIEKFVDKNPQFFKTLMKIQPLMEERMDTAEDKIALLERIVLEQIKKINTLETEMKILKGEYDQEHNQEHDASQDAVSLQRSTPSLSALLPHTTWGTHVNRSDPNIHQTAHQKSDGIGQTPN